MSSLDSISQFKQFMSSSTVGIASIYTSLFAYILET
jgi:hypothetical protein